MCACHAVGPIAARLIEVTDRTLQGRLRVAVTGITASGKSTLADEIAANLEHRGRRVTRIPVDGFHHPREVRYERGRESAEGYYRDAYDYKLLIERVLVPLGPDGSGVYQPRSFDFGQDRGIDLDYVEAQQGEIFLLDASFLLRPEVVDSFDYRIFVHADFEHAEHRGVKRDAADLGGEEEARRLYRLRYHEAQLLYFREADPIRHADLVVHNNDPSRRVAFERCTREPFAGENR